jgi:hypothetical protein
MRSSLYNSIREVDPLENGGDDWPRLIQFCNEWAGKAAIYLRPGTWRCNTRGVLPNETVIIGSPGVDIIQALTPSGAPVQAAFFAGAVAAGAGDTTLAVNAVVGAITVLTVATVPPGTIIGIQRAGFSQLLFYTVISVAGPGPFVLTLDRPVKFAFLLGDTVTVYTSQPTDIHIIGDGMKISGTGDNHVYFQGGKECSVEGLICNTVNGTVTPSGVGTAFGHFENNQQFDSDI